MSIQEPRVETKAIYAIDQINEVVSLIDCIFMSVQGLEDWQCGAIETVCNVSKSKLYDARAKLEGITKREA